MLEIRGLNQFYGGSHTLRGIDLSVPAGTCTALLGRNGVGKTTLLRCLMGLLPARSGRIAFEGADIAFPGQTKIQRRVKHGRRVEWKQQSVGASVLSIRAGTVCARIVARTAAQRIVMR